MADRSNSQSGMTRRSLLQSLCAAAGAPAIGALAGTRPAAAQGDIAIDQGGCVETSHPTTHHDPVFVEEGITHYCVANMPGAYARTATQALTSATYRYIELLADCGLAEACQRHPALVSGINIMNRKLTNKAVAEAHGMAYTPPAP